MQSDSEECDRLLDLAHVEAARSKPGDQHMTSITESTAALARFVTFLLTIDAFDNV